MRVHRFGLTMATAAIATTVLTAPPAHAAPQATTKAQTAAATRTAAVQVQKRQSFLTAKSPVVHKKKGKKGKYVYGRADYRTLKKPALARACVYLVWITFRGPQAVAGKCQKIKPNSKGTIKTPSVSCWVAPMRVKVFGFDKKNKSISTRETRSYKNCGK